MPAGRPSEYNEDISARICARLANGESLRTICIDDDMPSKTTVFKWLARHPEFVDQYAQAKEASADALIEDMLAIADDDTGDVARHKLMVDTRKWLATKLKPKKYGDRLDHDITTGGKPLVFTKDEENL